MLSPISALTYNGREVNNYCQNSNSKLSMTLSIELPILYQTKLLENISFTVDKCHVNCKKIWQKYDIINMYKAINFRKTLETLYLCASNEYISDDYRFSFIFYTEKKHHTEMDDMQFALKKNYNSSKLYRDL